MDVLLIMFGGIVLFFVVPWLLMGLAIGAWNLWEWATTSRKSEQLPVVNKNKRA